MMVATRTGLTAVLLLLIAGCAGPTMESLSLDSREEQAAGFTYALPRGFLSFGIKSSNGTITLEPAMEVKMVPDPQARFNLRFLHSAFADDDFTAETNERGMLTSINSVADDKSVAIVQKTIALVTNVVVAGADLLAAKTETPQTRNFTIVTTLDPFNPGRALSDVMDVSDIRITVADIFGNALPPYDADRERQVTKGCQSSICFRMLTPVVLTMRKRDDTGSLLAKFIMLVPNPYFVGEYAVTRTACVNRTIALNFSNGILTKAQSKKPSEVLGCLQIPIDVAKAVVAIPAELIKVKIENNGQQQALLQSQANLLAAQTQLLQSQAALNAQLATEAASE